MADLNGFDANAVEPNKPFDALPAGKYDVVIVKSEMKATKSGEGRYLEMELQILNGEHQNRKLFDRLNLENKSEKTVQIARGTLSSICRAVGVLTPKDSSELHFKPLRCKVNVSKDDNGNPKNDVKGYEPRQAGPAPVPQQAAPQPAMASNGANPFA